MQEINDVNYDATADLNIAAVPDDTITIVMKCGGKVYLRGIKMPDTQEKTAALVGNMMQTVLDTVDAKGLKAGGSRHA